MSKQGRPISEPTTRLRFPKRFESSLVGYRNALLSDPNDTYESRGLEVTLLKGCVVVNYGGGTNSTALILALHERSIPVNLILFADTGAEHQYTYHFLDVLDNWLQKHDMPTITRTQKANRLYPKDTLERLCLREECLPSLAYGHKTCSMKWKAAPNDKYVRSWLKQQNGFQDKQVCRLMGYEKGEENRDLKMRTAQKDSQWWWLSPLITWGIDRLGCIDLIKKHGLAQPGKSSCIFCPSMRHDEIIDLAKSYPDDLERALEIERNAKPHFTSVKGLGRNFSWEDFIKKWKAGECQGTETELPTICECYL